MNDRSTIDVQVQPGLRFTADVGGPEDGPLVLLLHGFPESRATWQRAVERLGAAGYRAVAPDQRGYSPGARPDPADLSNYAYDHLIADALAIADATGASGRRFHVVGHDWGGQVSWGVAARHPERIASLTVLSRPHPSAFARALRNPDGEQRHRSRHHRSFLDGDTASLLLEDGARRLRGMLSGAGVPDTAVDAHLVQLGTRDGIEAALAWYRANQGLAADLGPITVPTLYVWGDADSTVGREAAEGTRDFATGPFRMVELADVGHFVMDQAADRTVDLVAEHLAAHPV